MVDKIKRADVANFIRSFKGGNFDQLMRRDGTGFFQKLQKAFVYNNTGVALEIGSPVYISGTMNELAYDELVNEYLTSGFCLKGETYDSDYPDRPVAFALEPIKEDGIGECRIGGLTPAILTGYNEGDKYTAINDDGEIVSTGDESDYRIVGVSQENEDGKRFAYLFQASPSGDWKIWVRVSGRYSVHAGRPFRITPDWDGDYKYNGETKRIIDMSCEERYNEFLQKGIVFDYPGHTSSLPAGSESRPYNLIPMAHILESIGSDVEDFSLRYVRAYVGDDIIATPVFVPRSMWRQLFHVDIAPDDEESNRMPSREVWEKFYSDNGLDRDDSYSFRWNGKNATLASISTHPAVVRIGNTISGSAAFLRLESDRKNSVLNRWGVVYNFSAVCFDPDSEFFCQCFCIVKRESYEDFIYGKITGVDSYGNITADLYLGNATYTDTIQSSVYYNTACLPDERFVGGSVVLLCSNGDWASSMSGGYKLVSIIPPTSIYDPIQNGDNQGQGEESEGE